MGGRQLGLRRCAVLTGGALLAFGAAFAVTNPSALAHWAAFRRDVTFEQSHLAFGHEFRVAHVGWLWMADLGRTVGPLHGLLALGVVVFLFGTRKIRRGETVLLVWAGVVLGFLIGFANLRAPRHLLPIVPVVQVFAAAAYGAAWRWLHPRAGAGAPAVLAAVLAGLSWSHLAAGGALFEQKRTRVETCDEIAAGRWLDQAFPDSTSILYDPYAYVPEKFHNAFRASNLSYVMVTHFEPDLVLVRDAIADRYDDPEDAGRAQMGAAAFRDSHFFYAFLQAGLLPDYTLLRDFGRVHIYKRTAPGNPRYGGLTWVQRVVLYAQGRLLGADDAYRKMGQILRAQGQNGEADRFFAQAQQAQKRVDAQFAKARDLLGKGDKAGAGRVFDQMQADFFTQSTQDRAMLALLIGRAYLETGYLKEAIASGRQALAVQPDFKDAMFDLGFFYLVGGEQDSARAAYARAIARFGTDARAENLLHQLIHQNLQALAAKQMLAAFFDGKHP